jgi:hypothetical protein
LPISSGNVTAFKFTPIFLVLEPNKTNAMNIPTKMFRNTSHNIPIPKAPAYPPKPIMAEVLMKAAP